jgi:hypothetical protein
MNNVFKACWLCFILIVLSGCTTNREDSYLFNQSSHPYLALLKNNTLSKEQARALPYAALEVALNDEHTLLMPLGYLEGALKSEQQQWFSTDLFSFTTQNGRVIQIYNTDEEISAIERVDFYKNIYLQSMKPRQSFQFIVSMDFLTQKRFGVKGFLKVQVKGMEERILWGQSVSLLRIEEEVSIPSMNFTFLNLYWKDPKTNFIWESIQKWSPNALKIHYKVVKPWIEVTEP